MKKFDEINIIPFIDIMLVLLAIVLVTASFISQGKIQVNVPKASTAVAFKSDELAKLLTVTANGELYLIKLFLKKRWKRKLVNGIKIKKSR